eukprot:353182-Chlamydomonas_euryale.AAC.10
MGAAARPNQHGVTAMLHCAALRTCVGEEFCGVHNNRHARMMSRTPPALPPAHEIGASISSLAFDLEGTGALKTRCGPVLPVCPVTFVCVLPTSRLSPRPDLFRLLERHQDTLAAVHARSRPGARAETRSARPTDTGPTRGPPAFLDALGSPDAERLSGWTAVRAGRQSSARANAWAGSCWCTSACQDVRRWIPPSAKARGVVDGAVSCGVPT